MLIDLVDQEIYIIAGLGYWGEWECFCGYYLSPCKKIHINRAVDLALRAACRIAELPTSIEKGNGCFDTCTTEEERKLKREELEKYYYSCSLKYRATPL